MFFYKIKHIPTGLFYKPSTHGSKSNLSKKGKVYQKKPTLKYIQGGFYHQDDVKDMNKYSRSRIPVTPFRESEWEVIEYEVQ